MTRPQLEEWRPIPGFPGYSASSFGRVVSHLRWKGQDGPRELAGRLTAKGYLRMELRPEGGGTKSVYVHGLIARAFYGPRPEGLETRHLDGRATNNCVTNLVYGTKSENRLDCIRHGTHREASKTRCLRGHPFDEVNTYVTRAGHRTCRTCARAKSNARRAALRAALAVAA